MATKKQRDKAYQEGMDAADRGERGMSPYEKADPGWHWISGWELRMGAIEKAKRERPEDGAEAADPRSFFCGRFQAR